MIDWQAVPDAVSGPAGWGAVSGATIPVAVELAPPAGSTSAASCEPGNLPVARKALGDDQPPRCHRAVDGAAEHALPSPLRYT